MPAFLEQVFGLPCLFAEVAQLDAPAIFGRLGMATLLGFLVGMQREHTEGGMPGLRTFPLITLSGSVFAILGNWFGGWLPASALICLVGLLFFPNWLRIRRAEPDPGLTTSVAVILMYGIGALLVVTRLEIGVVLGGVVAVLLQFKPELHRISERLDNEDVRAIMQFVLITCIILPILPKDTVDPLGVISPFNVWMMVVLIVGISLGGYIAYKLLGQKAGIFLAGLLGGAVSSTATTISAARQSRDDRGQEVASTIIVLLASTVMFARVFIEIAVVHIEMLRHCIAPLALIALATYLPGVILWRRVRKQSLQIVSSHENPTQLRAALYFAALYAIVLFLIAWVKQHAGATGLYPLAILSGLHDMDAITLSISRMAIQDQELSFHGWRYIAAAIVANMVVKSLLGGMMGHTRFGLRLALGFVPAFFVGLSLILFWP
ncbi:MAG: MgtC/SapB family protein [Thermogutta sp.]